MSLADIMAKLAAGKTVRQIENEWLADQRLESYAGTPEGRLRKELRGQKPGMITFGVSKACETLGGFIEMCAWGEANGWLTRQERPWSTDYTPTQKAWDEIAKPHDGGNDDGQADTSSRRDGPPAGTRSDRDRFS